MPRIPIFQPEVNLTTKGAAGPTAVEQDIRSFGVENLVTAKNWEGVGQAGVQLSAVGLKLDKHLTDLQDMNDLDQAKNFVNQRALEYSQSAKNNANPDDWLTSFRGDMGTSVEAALEGMNPRVAMHLKNHVTTMMPSYERRLVQDARDYKISGLKGNIPKSMDAAIQTAVDAPDDIVADNAETGFKALVRTAASREFGYLKPEEATKWEAKFDLGLKTARVNKAMLSDPAGTLAALKEPGGFGLDDNQRAGVLPGVSANLNRFQKDNYGVYMQNILGATADQPIQGAVMPTESEILAQMNAGHLSTSGGKEILAYVRGQKGNRENKTDPQSYKAAVTRLTDPDNPLTREEFLKNMESGDWKLDAHTYGSFLSNINARGTKLDKATDSAIKSRIGFWRTQFGQDPKGDQIMTALGQVQAAKDAGELGKTPDEINKAVDAIFAPQHNLYMQEWSLGTKKPAPAKPGIISRIGGLFSGSSGADPGPESITKNGRTFRVLTVNGQKMVDPNPLPPAQSGPPGRAEGGPVEEGQTYRVGENGPEILAQADGNTQVVGENGPEMITVDQNGEVLPNKVLQEVLKEYPGLQRVHSLKETSVVFASPERLKAAKEASKEWSSTGDPGYLEYWPKDESGMPDFPHPSGGQGNVLEIYDAKLKDPEVLKPMILGDLLHGMTKDPGFAKLRGEFKENYSPEAQQLIESRKGQDDFYSADSTVDAFIRGALVPYRGGNWMDENPALYSPKQLEILKKIKQYLQTHPQVEK